MFYMKNKSLLNGAKWNVYIETLIRIRALRRNNAFYFNKEIARIQDLNKEIGNTALRVFTKIKEKRYAVEVVLTSTLQDHFPFWGH